MADNYEIDLEIEGGEQPEIVMETEGGATDGASARNAEAWAAGTRNGVPVGENDPAYHNNSKYYRDSAAAIVAGDIIDDDAGRGDTMLAWSADKLVGEFGKKAPAIVVSDTTPSPVKTLTDGADGLPMALTVGIEPVQAGSGDPSPSNVRAISGWDAVEISRTGINIWDEQWELGSLNTDGTVKSADNVIRTKNFIPAKGGETYYIHGYPFVYEYDANHNYIKSTWVNNTTITTDEKCHYLKFRTSSGITTYGGDISINYPSTDTSYHSGTGNTTYEITIPSTPGTVYGGSLTVNKDGTGKLVVDRARISPDLYTFYPLESGNDIVGRFGHGSVWGAVNSANFISNALLITTIETTSNRPMYSFYCKPSNYYPGEIKLPGTYDTSEKIKAFLADIDGNGTRAELVYKMATPTEYTLTASQVNALITSLKGENNIFCDAGGILSVDYSADTKLYVDGKISDGMKLMALLLTANHEDSMKASKAYASGDLLTVGNTLYKATTSIANGATLTEGTNVTETTIAQELAALA